MADQNKSLRSRPRLGRGLCSLISNPADLVREGDQEYQHVTGLPPVAAAPAAPAEVPIDAITPNPFQPRKEFPAADLDELTESIRQQGILQPLVVSPADGPAGDRYFLIAGERRLRAARQAGLATVPCVVRQASQQQFLEWALIENIHRADLNPIERAEAYRQYVDRFALTQAEAAERLGQPRATVANYLRLLDLHEEVRGMVACGLVSFGHAKVLAGLVGQDDRQLELARKVAGEGLSVRQLEQLAGEVRQDAGEAPPAPRPARGKAPYVRDLEERLSQSVGTRVTILPGRSKNSGRVVVDYYSLEDFDRISGLLGLSERG